MYAKNSSKFQDEVTKTLVGVVVLTRWVPQALESGRGGAMGGVTDISMFLYFSLCTHVCVQV